MAALKAANGRANVAVEIPTEVAPKLASGAPVPASFVAPPRTISDITAILDSEKPDIKVIEKLRSAAEASPTGKESPESLAQFYFDRGNARAQLGRLDQSIADANKAVEAGRAASDPSMMGRLMQFAGQQYLAAGEPRKALEIYERQLRDIAKAARGKGYQFNANRQVAGILIQMGDIAQAEAYLRRNLSAIQEARTSGHPAWRAAYAKFGQSWEAEVEFTRAIIYEARGQFSEAEASYRATEQRKRASVRDILASPDSPSASTLLWGIDTTVLNLART
jgi:tetratricopeptide (TPR) repeat protein